MRKKPSVDRLWPIDASSKAKASNFQEDAPAANRDSTCTKGDISYYKSKKEGLRAFALPCSCYCIRVNVPQSDCAAALLCIRLAPISGGRLRVPATPPDHPCSP